jgi:hypothetical protein
VKTASALILAGCFVACANPEDPDAGAPDAGGIDAAPIDGSAADLGSIDTGGNDADSGAGDVGSTDALPDAGELPCNDPVTLDGVVYNSLLTGRRTLYPREATPVVFDEIAQPDPHESVGLSRVRGAPRLAWTAQISHLIDVISVDVNDVLPDPNDGSIYAIVEVGTQDTSTELRFYDADGDLARTLVRGTDLFGDGQNHFFAVKYDEAGNVVWVSRFGPNVNAPLSAQSTNFGGATLTSSGLRVIASVGRGPMVVGAGAPNPYELDAPEPHLFWARSRRPTAATSRAACASWRCPALVACAATIEGGRSARSGLRSCGPSWARPTES